MKRMIALLLILCLAIGLTACEIDLGFMQINFGEKGEAGNNNTDSEEKQDLLDYFDPDDLISSPESKTIYVLVSEAHYLDDGTNFQNFEYTYDERGYRTAMSVDTGEMSEVWNDTLGIYEYGYANADGEADTLFEYEYDDNGYPTKQTATILSDNSYLHYDEEIEYDYEYDRDGYLETISCDYGNDLEYEYRITCDSDGNVVEIEVHYGSGSFEAHSEYSYDSEGRLTSEWYNRREYENGYAYEYTYEGERLIRIENLSREWELEYNEDGKLTDLYRTDMDDAYEFQYDKNGHLKEYSYNDETTEVETDANGNVTKVTAEDGSYIEYEYEALKVSAENAMHYDSCVSAEEGYGIRPSAYDNPKMYNITWYLIPDPIPSTIFYR